MATTRQTAITNTLLRITCSKASTSVSYKRLQTCVNRFVTKTQSIQTSFLSLGLCMPLALPSLTVRHSEHIHTGSSSPIDQNIGFTLFPMCHKMQITCRKAPDLCIPRMTAPYHTHEWSMILTSPTTDAHGATKVVDMVKPRSSCRFITGRCFKSGHQIRRHYPRATNSGSS